MFLPSPRLCCLLTAAAVACVWLPEQAMANTGQTRKDQAYLNWRNKAAPPVPTVAPQAVVTSGGESYAVPPSPYGQVGDPFARALNWPAKAGTKAGTKAKQVASVAPLPVPQAPVAPIAVPAPPVVIEPKSPVASIAAPVPVPAPRPVSVPAPIAPQASVAPSKADPAPGSVPLPPTGYQVPATSKYAARIASARAAQAWEAAQVASQAAQSPAPAKPAAKAATATVPAPSASLASQETDHVFIPGEQFTDAREAPRFYSLHRAYGLAPDPITVDHNATGAILGTADLNADEGEAKADDTKTASSSSHDKP